jgi:small subunit ribosomal protein S17
MTSNRKRLTGLVTSAKMQKTVKVRVDRSYRHPLYGKVVRSYKNYLVHDELECQPGDIVCMVESRPVSKKKRWVVQEILRRATEAEVAADQEEVIDELEEVMVEIEEATQQLEEAEAEVEMVVEEAAQASDEDESEADPEEEAES